MDSKLKALLSDGIKTINPQLNNDTTLKILEKLYDEITLFNPTYKLVSAEGEELVVKHILDCMAPYPIIKKLISDTASFADLGSGSGLPGLVLASAFDNRFTLVERMGRRAGFLRSTIALTGLSNRVEVCEKDLSEVSGTFDVITFRAFRQMKDIYSDLDRITHSGSYILIYKSTEENINEDLQHVDPSVFTSSVETYSVPFLNAQRSLLVLHKS